VLRWRATPVKRVYPTFDDRPRSLVVIRAEQALTNKNAGCPVPRTAGVFYVEKLLLRRDFEDHTVALGAAVLGRTVEFALI
jgi:hypothetical protein